MLRGLGSLREVLRVAAGFLACLWVPAAVLLVGARVKPFGATEAWLAVLAVAAWLALRAGTHADRVPSRLRWILGAVAALAILAGYGAWIVHRIDAVQLPGTDLWVFGGDNNPTGATNEFRMRGTPGRDRPAGVPVVALVGCSMILGTGVGDDDAPHVALERALRSDQGLETRVFNFAVPSGGAHPLAELIGYAVDGLRPDRVVAYFPMHHVQPSIGVAERMALLNGNLAYRLLVTTHYEALLPLVQPLFGGDGGGDGNRTGAETVRWFLEGLDGFAVAAGTTPLVIVSDMRDGSHRGAGAADILPPVAPGRLKEWIQAHPRVTVLDVSDDPAWQAAATQPDHHWTAEGIRTVMGILAGRLAPLLAGNGGR